MPSLGEFKYVIGYMLVSVFRSQGAPNHIPLKCFEEIEIQRFFTFRLPFLCFLITLAVRCAALHLSRVTKQQLTH